MEFEESIFNLIPKERYEPPKPKRYKSTHPHDVPPTSTTFALKTTSKPQIANVSGDYKPEGGAHSQRGVSLTFGRPRGTLKPESTLFQKKGTGNPVLPPSGTLTKFQYTDDIKRAPVPKKDEKPIMGLVSDKNYIVANAVENILAAPKLPANTEKDYLKKKNFGKVPKYIQKIKNEIEDEYQMVREMQIEEENERDKQKFLMTDDERKELIAALKKKWEVVHKEYQEITHIQKIDTIGKKKKKETCEHQLAQLEKDI
jgi:hypothetical protein